MNDFEKFKEKFLSKEKFYRFLTDRKLNDKEFEHVVNVCNKFEMKTMKDYHELYLKCNVLLLAHVFEKFKNNSLKNHGFCLSHYLSARDLDMYIFFKEDTRSGISYISNRYRKANNKYLKSYDPKQESEHIIYLDAINIYSYVMPKFFPTSGLKWINPKEFDLNKYTSNSPKDCVSRS